MTHFGWSAVDGADNGFKADLAEEGIALADRVLGTGGHSLEGLARPIYGDDQDVLAGLLAGFLNCLDSANGHVVVMGVHRVDGLVGLQEGFHNLLAVGGVEVARLRLDDLHSREIGDDIGEALLPHDGGVGAGSALEFGDIGLAAHLHGEPGRNAPAFRHEIGCDLADVEGVVVRRETAIEENYRDLRILAFLENIVPTGSNDGNEENAVDFLGDKGAEGSNLVLLPS